MRRALLVAVVVAAGVGGFFLWRSIRSPHAGNYGLREIDFTVHSRLVHDDLGQVAIVPSGGGDGRPLLVMLHGRGSEPSHMRSNQLYDVLKSLGARAPDVVMANGDDASYFHDRDTGEWGTYIVREVIPRAIRLTGADPKRVAITGTSMGGFGALDIARLWPERFCAAGGNSPAIFLSGDRTSAGSFDDAEDFARHDLLAIARTTNPYGRMPLWIDVGNDEFFTEANSEFAQELLQHKADLAFHMWPGGHADAHWNGHYPEYIRFFARALAHCSDSRPDESSGSISSP